MATMARSAWIVVRTVVLRRWIGPSLAACVVVNCDRDCVRRREPTGEAHAIELRGAIRVIARRIETDRALFPIVDAVPVAILIPDIQSKKSLIPAAERDLQMRRASLPRHRRSGGRPRAEQIGIREKGILFPRQARPRKIQRDALLRFEQQAGEGAPVERIRPRRALARVAPPIAVRIARRREAAGTEDHFPDIALLIPILIQRECGGRGDDQPARDESERVHGLRAN